MRNFFLLIPKFFCASCADFWVPSILGMPACRYYVIDPLLAASAPQVEFQIYDLTNHYSLSGKQ